MKMFSQTKCFVLIAFLVALCETASDIYAPSLPELLTFFSTSPTLVSLTMSVNLLGLAGSALIYGPLSDRVGRRPVILFAVAVFAISSFFASVSSSITELIVWRLLQGMGAGVGPVMGYACMRDCFQGDACAQQLSRMSMITALSPALGPIIGAFLVQYFSWPATFVTVSVCAGFLWMVFFFSFGETLKHEKKSATETLCQGYQQLLRSKDFMLFVLAEIIVLGALWGELAHLPLIYIDGMGLTALQYSLAFSLTVGVYIVGCFINQSLVMHYGSGCLLFVGLALQLISAVSITVLFIFCPLHPFVIQTLKIPSALGFSFLIPNITSKALSLAQNYSGVASAILTFSHMGIGALIIYIISFFHDGSILPLIVLMWMSIVSLSLILTFGRYRKI